MVPDLDQVWANYSLELLGFLLLGLIVGRLTSRRYALLAAFLGMGLIWSLVALVVTTTNGDSGPGRNA